MDAANVGDKVYLLLVSRETEVLILIFLHIEYTYSGYPKMQSGMTAVLLLHSTDSRRNLNLL
jgi:hypothetical protein